MDQSKCHFIDPIKGMLTTVDSALSKMRLFTTLFCRFSFFFFFSLVWFCQIRRDFAIYSYMCVCVCVICNTLGEPVPTNRTVDKHRYSCTAVEFVQYMK